MRKQWERILDRWLTAGLLDGATAARIRAFEAIQQPGSGLRWPMALAIAFGGVLVGAGVLLFVAAHWDALAPGSRFALVVLLVGGFHLVAASTANRFPELSVTCHALGTIALGAGIFLSGQIFHLEEHWPRGVMLWALGAWVAVALLRDWPQVTLAAVLTPIWVCSEWIEASGHRVAEGDILAQGVLLLTIVYLSAPTATRNTVARKALAWIGGLALIPGAVIVAVTASELSRSLSSRPEWVAVGWGVAYGLPLVLAAWLRGWAAWANVVAALWVIALGQLHLNFFRVGEGVVWFQLITYAWWEIGAIGLIAWGLWEQRRERINLGIAGFALIVVAFYFSSVMDKLGRSASLVGLGVLFLVGGSLLERSRRRLVARIQG